MWETASDGDRHRSVKNNLEDTYNHFSQELGLLEETTALLSTYTGEEIPVAGEVLVPVKYGNQEHKLSAVVVRSNGPNLLGRDWLQVIKVDLARVFNVETQPRNPSLQKVLDEHKEVFKDGLGTLKGVQAKIYVDTQASARYLKARPVPYALKEGVELEWL